MTGTTPGPRGAAAARLVLPFAGAYFLSYLFRTVNAVVGPVLLRELSLSAAAMGLLTGAYFLAFAAAQLPLGVLLDRFGSRRVESALLLAAAAGAVAFSAGRSLAALAAGRALIGLGVSACLMAAFKAFSAWFPAERQAALTGWIMTAGGLGALASSAPLEAALRVTGWRTVFLVLAAATVAAAAAVRFGVPEAARSRPPEPAGEQWRGLARVFRSAHFWRVAPTGLVSTGGFMAVQGLWSASWLQHVNHHPPAAVAGHLAAMGLAMLLFYVALGLSATPLARRGVRTAHLLGAGIPVAVAVLLAIVLEAVPHTRLLWVLYGAFSSVGTLVYAEAARGFPVELSGRANTALNLLVFVGAFAIQWGMGGAIDALSARGFTPAAAHRATFGALAAAQAVAWLWFLAAGRRAAPR